MKFLEFLYITGELYVINISSIDIEGLLNQSKPNPLKEIITEIRQQSNEIAKELLRLLQKLTSRGPIPALLEADTAIGRTLEAMLGIGINSSKKPDYKGIELKIISRCKRKQEESFCTGT
jgi:hypothetical protein